jgi:hypothetical protein
MKNYLICLSLLVFTGTVYAQPADMGQGTIRCNGMTQARDRVELTVSFIPELDRIILNVEQGIIDSSGLRPKLAVRKVGNGTSVPGPGKAGNGTFLSLDGNVLFKVVNGAGQLDYSEDGYNFLTVKNLVCKEE